MRILNACAGVLFVAAGICGAVYVGLYLCLVGGIIQIIEGAKADPVISGEIAWGVVRVLLAKVGVGIPLWCGFTLGAGPLTRPRY